MDKIEATIERLEINEGKELDELITEAKALKIILEILQENSLTKLAKRL